MNYVEMGKIFIEIPLRDDINPPDMEDVVTCISITLDCLAPAIYEYKMDVIGNNHVFSVFKNGQLLGKYRLVPGFPGKPFYGPDDPQLSNEWDVIWMTIWIDLARKFGRWDGRGWGTGKQQKGTRQGRESLKDSDPEEYVYRLAKAQEAREIYNNRINSNTTWGVICKQIGWRQGNDKSAVKLLYYARQDLEWLEKSDPDGWLDKVSEYRRKEKKIND